MLHFVMADKEKWIFTFALGALALGWPMLKVFENALPHYLFGVWGVIMFVAWLLSRGGRG